MAFSVSCFCIISWTRFLWKWISFNCLWVNFKMELFRIDLVFFFCWSSKTHGTGREGFYFSKLFFFLNLFLKINRSRKKDLFYSLKSSNVRVLEAQGLAVEILISTPYSVREWWRFLTKLSRLLGKSNCFQPVSFDTLCNRQFRCRGVSIINFACVMTDSRPLKNSQTAAEELQSSIFVLKLCLLAEMNL